MKHFRLSATFLLTIAGMLLPMLLRAQAPNSVENSGLAGTEYYIAFPQSDDEFGGAQPKFMGVLISSQVATQGVIDVPGASPISFETLPGKATSVELPRALEFLTAESEEVTSKGVHITSRAPISVFVLNARYQSTGGYPALPVTHWGQHYQTLTLPNQIRGNVSQIVIVAAYNDTRVTIRPNAQTYRASAGQEVTKWMMKGETYCMLAFPGEAGVADLSASEITSTNPVAVISGHVRTSVTADNSINQRDYATHQATMLLPDASWEKSYMSVPLRSSGDRFRLMPSIGGTVVTLTHYVPGGAEEKVDMTLGRGEYVDISTINGRPITGPVQWTANNPFMLMQLRTSGLYGDPKDAPAMVALTATDQMSSRSVFAAPEEIRFANFTHTLTLVARGPGAVNATDPSNPLRSIKLDGRPIYEIAPELLTQKIGTKGFYHVTLGISSGSHTIVSDPASPFTGVVQGENGTIGRDSYVSPLPFWMPEMAADLIAPYLVKTENPAKGILSVTVSDRTDSYFSGVRDIRPAASSTGWRREGISPLSPDVDARADFRAIADPSGPLDVELVDRDGNVATVRLSDNVCFKTAVADRSSMRIEANLGSGVFAQSVQLTTNQCGDQASVRGITLGNGTAASRLDLTSDHGTGAFVLAPGSSAAITLTAKSGTPAGIYTTTLRVTVDDSTLVLPVELVVGTSSVTADPVTSEISGFYPNPFTGSTTFRLMHPLDRDASITISDHLGRVVRILGSDELHGRSEITWNGDDATGRALPSGLYLVTVDRQGARSARAVTLVR